MSSEEEFETRYRHGIRLFNERAFFDAHEELEDVWRVVDAADKPFLQGLIQVAVALHHFSKGNLVGAASLLNRGEKNLASYPDRYGNLDLSTLRTAIARWREALAGRRAPPEPPQLLIADGRIQFVWTRAAPDREP